MNRPEEKDYFIKTDCGGEVMRVTDWYDAIDLKTETTGYWWWLCLSFYNNFYVDGSTSFKQKLRHIWHIIKTGHPWKDQVMLNIDNAIELRNKLNELIERAEHFSSINKEK